MSADLSEKQLKRLEKVFKEHDASGDGNISDTELKHLLTKYGFVLTERDLRMLLDEVDTDHDGQISFDEFCNMIKCLTAASVEYRAHNIIPRWYMEPKQIDQYRALFQKEAGEDGQIDSSEMAHFLASTGMKVSAENLEAIMSELDVDHSGSVDEEEFLVLIVKLLRLKKRKIGPNLCLLSVLRAEGWSNRDLIKMGYTSQAFKEANYSTAELLTLFTVPELRKAGVELSDLLETNWNGQEAREAGFTLNELYESHCSVKKIRTAGYRDVMSAVHLRKLGFGAKQMQLGGFNLSELKYAGFSGSELRCAGFSAFALQAIHGKMLERERAASPVHEHRRLRRPNTFRIREELDGKIKQEDLPPRPNTVA